MPNVSANNIEIEYEAFGDPNSPPLLLINGFGSQLIFWDEELCGQLARSNGSFAGMVAVGMRVTPHPPRRSVREELPHTAPASGNNAKAH